MSSNPYQSFVQEKDPIRILGSTHKSLVRLVNGLTRLQLNLQPSPDKWSIRKIIGHLADEELVFSARCRWIMFEKIPTLIGYEQNAWVQGWLNEKESVAETLNRFHLLRKAQLRLIKNASFEDLEKYGNHEEFGKVTLRDLIPWVAGHDLNHIAQIITITKQFS